VEEHVGVAVAEKSGAVRHCHAAKHHRPVAAEFVHVVSNAYTVHDKDFK
jgi:hypothetical protein